MTYRDDNTRCARCGKTITSPHGVALSWAPFAFMCGGCFEGSEKDLRRTYGGPIQVTKREINMRVQDWPMFLAVLFVAGIVGFLGFMLVSAVTALDRVNVCYTRPMIVEDTHVTPHVTHHLVYLYGQIDWGEDRMLGQFDSFDAAVEGARKISCPLDVPTRTLQ